MIRYYCSGFDINNAFGHGLGEMFKRELKDTRSIVYIPGGNNIEKAKNKYIPAFRNHFKNIGITFDKEITLTSSMSVSEAKESIQNASFIMLMGGDPYYQKELCTSLDIINELKEYKGVMLGFSAGAMLMSKYIIITPYRKSPMALVDIADVATFRRVFLGVIKYLSKFPVLI